MGKVVFRMLCHNAFFVFSLYTNLSFYALLCVRAKLGIPIWNSVNIFTKERGNLKMLLLRFPLRWALQVGLEPTTP